MSGYQLNIDDAIQRSPDRVAATIDEITAIMDADEEVYFVIDAIGSVIWKRIDGAVRIGDICDQLLVEYEVSADDCERDVLAFCQNLVDRKLAIVP